MITKSSFILKARHAARVGRAKHAMHTLSLQTRAERYATVTGGQYGRSQLQSRRDECQYHRRRGGARGVKAITGAEVLTALLVKSQPLANANVVTRHRHQALVGHGNRALAQLRQFTGGVDVLAVERLTDIGKPALMRTRVFPKAAFSLPQSDVNLNADDGRSHSSATMVSVIFTASAAFVTSCMAS